MRTKPGGLPVTPRRIVLTGRGKKKGVAFAEEGIGVLNAQAPPMSRHVAPDVPKIRRFSFREGPPNRVGGLFERSRRPGASDPLVCRGDGTRGLMPLPQGTSMRACAGTVGRLVVNANDRSSNEIEPSPILCMKNVEYRTSRPALPGYPFESLDCKIRFKCWTSRSEPFLAPTPCRFS